MYEYSLTHSVNNTVQVLCRWFSWKKVNRITIKVGGMKQVNPELMTFIFAAVSKDTPAEGAILSVMIIPTTYHCYSCGREGMREDTQFLCPHCGSKNVKLLSGQEFSIEILEVEGGLFSNE